MKQNDTFFSCSFQYLSLLLIMTPSTSTRNTFLMLFYLILQILHVKVIGYNGCFQESRQKIPRCQRCTEECSENKNQMEVAPCTRKSNRICFCKPGFYCTNDNNYETHCHKPCVPCGKGTFSSKPSLGACKPHTNCTQLGMITLKEGTATQDRECLNVTTVMPSLSTTTKVINIITNTSIPRTEGTVQRRGSSEESQSYWLLLLILMLILFMAGFCMLMKNGAKKTFLKWLGSIKGGHKYHQPLNQTARDHQISSNYKSQTLETEISLSSDGKEIKGPMPQSGTVQQVTMEHNGKGENVSNTVGSGHGGSTLSRDTQTLPPAPPLPSIQTLSPALPGEH
ncbi:uncharacterized protein si:dkeyp-61b2.1 isoform X2 [Puntigrus tetrazona]|uniref:uncharacterized protein si:dkeyp-61b2.1 isoform X2 n=1 Tax=Puntigrus tetrazona TaxID=1606681 RepID=UPI001C8969C0|nr:uncharacterized protein si:dkeyp-61b2.1 isoform X2 [Puntigrus tetrazona]